ncbi:hypothetical protein D3C87_1575720 [compost metagenome]
MVVHLASHGRVKRISFLIIFLKINIGINSKTIPPKGLFVLACFIIAWYILYDIFRLRGLFGIRENLMRAIKNYIHG